MSYQDTWQTVLTEMELNVSKASFNTWFQNTYIISIKDGLVSIGVPNAFTKEWLENKYNQYIFKILKGLDPQIKLVEYKIEPKTQKPLEKTIKTIKNKVSFLREQLDLPHLEIDKETNLNPKYTFDSFIVGSFNELAYAAAMSVIEKPGKSYNPFFIYGGVGLGKTHLIQAIGNKILEKYKKLKIKYLPCEKFTNELVLAIRNKKMNEFKEKYREIDVLILDDIQFLGGKEKTQEEFFHTFNNLYDSNKQIILSSDKPPKAIAMLEERLRSRFEGGMIADIGYPEYETRVVILKEKCKEKNVEIDDATINYIAANIQKNIRELEGALNKVSAHLLVTKGSISQNNIQKILKHMVMRPQSSTTPRKIIQNVSEFYEISEKALLEKNRKQEVVKPRQIVMYLLREELNWSYPSIGLKLGGRDHTTVIHACEKINEVLKRDELLQNEINIIKQRFYNS